VIIRAASRILYSTLTWIVLFCVAGVLCLRWELKHDPSYGIILAGGLGALAVAFWPLLPRFEKFLEEKENNARLPR
jgi:hypothetical protein